MRKANTNVFSHHLENLCHCRHRSPGAQVADKKYSVRFLSRDAASRRAMDLLALDNVSMLEGSFADEAILREGFRGCDGAFINIDGFNTGEKT